MPASSTSRKKPEEWIVPFPKPRHQVTDAKRFRSTWLTASQATIRERGHAAAYEAALEPAYKERVLAVVPGVWEPMEVAYAHYSACDRLGLPEPDLFEIGFAATRRANAATLALMSRLAQGAGATPWSILAQTPRLWSATCDGGAVAVAKLGPKEARIEVVGFPLAAIPYNRITMRGIVASIVQLLCTKVYMHEIPALCDARALGMRASWV